MIKNKKKPNSKHHARQPGYLLFHLAGKILQAECGGTHTQSQHAGD